MADEKRFPREGKVYALRSSAIRAAKQDGLVDGQFTVQEILKKGRTSDWKYIVNETHRAVAEQMAPKIAEKVAQDKKVAEKPSPTGKKAKPSFEEDDIIPVKPLVIHDEHVDGKYVEEEPPAAELPTPTLRVVKSATSDQPTRVMKEIPQKAVKPIPGAKKDPNRLHKSQVESPTKLVWHIAFEMSEKNPNVTRKQVVDECVKRGIAFYTARTQYQQWVTAKRESELNAAKVNTKVKKQK